MPGILSPFMSGPMGPQAPQSGFGSLFGGDNWLARTQRDNPEVLLALGSGLMNGNLSQGFANAAPLMAAGRKRNATAKFLLDRGIARDPEEAAMFAQSPELIQFTMKAKGNLINAGDGRLYNQDTGEWILAPTVGGQQKAPDITELFDENGQPYKAQWNATTGSWDKVGGSKPTGTTEAVRRNKQLYSVVAPEAKNLETKFDALTSGWNQAGDYLGRGGPLGGLVGGDLSGFTTSSDYQSAKNSLKVVVANYLYSVSGATATPGEVENQVSVLMPKPGEGPESLAQKKERIATMVNAIREAAMVPGDGASTGGDPITDNGGWTIQKVP